MVTFFKPWIKYQFKVADTKFQIDKIWAYDPGLLSVSCRIIPLSTFEMTFNWDFNIPWADFSKTITIYNGYNADIIIKQSRKYGVIKKITLRKPYRLNETFINGISMFDLLMKDERINGHYRVLDIIDDIVLSGYDHVREMMNQVY